MSPLPLLSAKSGATCPVRPDEARLVAANTLNARVTSKFFIFIISFLVISARIDPCPETAELQRAW